MGATRAALSRRRCELGLTQEGAAHAAGVDRSTWHRWETGQTTPRPNQRRGIAAALDVSLADLVPLLEQTTPGGTATPPAPPLAAHVVLPRPSLDDEVESAVHDRRRFLILTGAALTTALTGTAASPLASLSGDGRGSKLDPAVLQWLEEGVPRLRRMDDHVAGEGLRQVVLGQLRIAIDLLYQATTTGEQEQRLLTVISHLAQLGGWISFDEGWHSSAQTLFSTSLKAAHTIPDPGLIANTLAAMSLQSALSGHPDDGVHLATTALEHATDQSPLIQTMLATRLARAHARQGDSSSCGKALNLAERHLDAAPSGRDAPEWIYYFDPAELQAQAGACWVDLGQPHRALPVLHTALDGLSPTYVRDGAIYRIRTATAHIDMGDLDQGCTVLTDALPLVHQAKAARPLEDLRALHTRLDPRDPHARDLNDQMHALIG
ncbi:MULTISPECIES: helix-turn-helix transcriptional regulator [unclassified Nocardiopsis]|uniref:helix-turn-helix transcriptional regulator n=1 Tax=unclassified Nocardiopsis TaxID=2649073 RepID=UPI00135AAD8A|nr:MULTISPECIES: helix-turn-helix transcriptional regulator [unclassified Nocardiopsis]